MAKILTICTLLTLISCSMNPHIQHVKDNQKNQWIEKTHVYRSLASIHNEKEELKRTEKK
jgi:hypothetical protein